ncbi:hypothetical protein FRC10_003126 [Ceratobasidium sp. 414]|nr:hypothetical protein FRC10_003126 [Ceratobasidium sp. 414]
MASTISEQMCYTVVCEGMNDSQDLRNALQKRTDEAKLEILRTIIVSTLNGNLIRSTSAIRFSEAAASVVHALIEFLGDTSNSAAVDVVTFVRSNSCAAEHYSIDKKALEKSPNLWGAITPD